MLTIVIIHLEQPVVTSKVIYPLVRNAQDCKEDVSNGHQYKNSKHLEHDEMQCKTEVTNTLRTEFPSLNYLQKYFKIQPQGVQRASKIHSGGLLGGQTEKNRFLQASRTPSRYGSASDTQLISKSVLEWFWPVLDTNFGVFFEVFVS